MATPKMKVVRVAFVGLGMRGHDAVERWTHIPGIQVMALCDYERDRAEKSRKMSGVSTQGKHASCRHLFW